MLCYQCEQTKRNQALLGCRVSPGTCGKDQPTADLQDILIYLIQGINQYHHRLIPLTGVDQAAAEFTLHGLFTTLTNVNFNPSRFVKWIQQAVALREQLKNQYQAAAQSAGQIPETLTTSAATWNPIEDWEDFDVEDLLDQAALTRVNAQEATVGADVIGLRVLILYGLKGLAAYAHHAWVLGFRDDAINRELARLLDYLANDPHDVDELLQQALATGHLNLQVMELLDKANTESFGAQEISQVRISPVVGKAILVSGHDLHDLQQLLEQTKDSGIHVYTHGELLPANAYPKLKAYPHLVGNYGGAWQHQQQEFAAFPGPIVVTSNCLIEPDKSYKTRLFSTGPAGWPGVRHIDNGDFSQVIQIAKTLPGFAQDEAEKTITIGFGRHSLFNAAGAVVDAVNSGALKHFFLIGGCDGAKPGRNYYTEMAEQTPQDSVILTLGCGKYRFNKEDFGNIGGIPRLLDVGQCNDAYSAIQIAVALAKAFNCGVNELPLSLMVSWFEQKATAVLLSLLALGIKNIHLGPSLPVYLTPNLVTVLQERFALKGNGTVAQDLQVALS